ncbi:tyrosine-type recombinase/integrase [Alloyangia pacifica]|uniref:tyrosine-type recombinase/integrase n=1 Tax=Alloyangia pacifica TaxID=311180 RepID=UPI0031DF5736
MRRSVRLTGIKVVTKANGRRYIYRRVDSRLIPLPNLPENHPDFLKAYQEAGNAPAPQRAGSGTIAALCGAYLDSNEYSSLAASTRAVWRRLMDRIREDRGKALVKDLRADHLRKDIRAFSPGASSMRLKAWRSLMRFAVDEGWITADPSIGLKPVKGVVTPHRQWTRDEIEKYRQHWQAGTPQRVAFEVIYWTGARCVDAVSLGFQAVGNDGWLRFTQVKTGGPAVAPASCRLPTWALAMVEDHQHFLDAMPRNRLLWIVTQTGKPRSVKGLSQWMSANASAAGLPHDCTAHGLRKARAAALAESGASTHQIGAWTGHESLSEISHYTKAADRKALLAGPEQEQNTGNSTGKVSNISAQRADK